MSEPKETMTDIETVSADSCEAIAPRSEVEDRNAKLMLWLGAERDHWFRRAAELEAWQSRAMATIRRLFDPEMFARLYPDLPPVGDIAVAIDAALNERDRLRATVATITAMVDHGLHSEDPDDHDCAVSPCMAVVLRRALGIEEGDR